MYATGAEWPVAYAEGIVVFHALMSIKTDGTGSIDISSMDAKLILRIPPALSRLESHYLIVVSLYRVEAIADDFDFHRCPDRSGITMSLSGNTLYEER